MSASLQGESHGLGTLQPPARYAIPARSSRAHLPPPAYPPQGVAQMGTRIVGMEAAIMRDDNERPIPCTSQPLVCTPGAELAADSYAVKAVRCSAPSTSSYY